MKKTIIIAEAGVNHNGSISKALKLVDFAAKAKADYIKFQTYVTEDLVQKKLQLANYQKKNIQNTNSQFTLLKKYELTENDYKKIIKRCKLKKIKFLSSPFDLKSINFLKKIGLKTIKIPSGEITNIPYLKEIGKLKLKVILSTGMSNVTEIQKAIQILRNSGTKKKNLILLHCNTEYPANLKKLNLKSIPFLGKKFKISVGYSDHSEGITASLAAVTLGACVIEKHFTLNKNLKGPDHKASLSPQELIALVSQIRNLENMLGNYNKKPYKEELQNIKYIRKYIVAKKTIIKGQFFDDANLTTKRSGRGIPAEDWQKILGKKSKYNFSPDENIKI